MIEQTVVGDLSARDLGHEVELTDGGTTYRGLIEQVQHRRYPYQDTDTSVLFMRTGNWSAHVTVPSETQCTIECDGPPTHAFADSAGTVSACGREGVTGLVVVDQRGWSLITCADCLANKFDVPHFRSCQAPDQRCTCEPDHA